MKNLMHNKRFVFLSLAMVIMLLCLSLAATPVFADTGLTLSPFGAIALNVTPGEKTTQQMVLTLGTQSQAMDIAVDVVGFGSALDGTPQVIQPAQDTDTYSARSFITVDKPSFHLDPGGSQTITAAIAVPANVGKGGRYALIHIHQLPQAGGAGAQSVSSFNIPVLLTIQGTTLIQTGKITGLTTSAVTSGQPIIILTYFQNTGNIHFKVEGEVTVKDAQGQTLDKISIPLSASSILPGATRQLTATLPSTSALATGYTIDSKVTLQDGTVLDETASTFPVTTQYVPPTTTPPSTPTTTKTQNVPTTAPTTVGSSTSGMGWVMPVVISIVVIIVAVLVILLVIRRRR